MTFPCSLINVDLLTHRLHMGETKKPITCSPVILELQWEKKKNKQKHVLWKQWNCSQIKGTISRTSGAMAIGKLSPLSRPIERLAAWKKTSPKINQTAFLGLAKMQHMSNELHWAFTRIGQLDGILESASQRRLRHFEKKKKSPGTQLHGVKCRLSVPMIVCLGEADGIPEPFIAHTHWQKHEQRCRLSTWLGLGLGLGPF